MNDLEKIYRYWVSLTLAVILLATLSVAGLILLRSWETERESQITHEQIIERYLVNEYTSIAEEIYLGLDNRQARQRAITDLLGKRADVQLAVTPKDNSPLLPKNHYDEDKFLKLSWDRHDSGNSKLSTRLYFGDLYVGSLDLLVSWHQGWSFGGIRSLSITLGGMVVFLGISWFLAFKLMRRKVFNPIIHRMVELNRFAAMSQITQMIAHDVRGPFHSLRMVLETIMQAKDPSTLKPLAESALPELIKDVDEVEDMLRDISAFDKPLSPRLVSIDLETIIRNIVRRVASTVDGGESLIVDYSFSHDIGAAADSGKITRVLRNLLRNAFQAAAPAGCVWIETGNTEVCGKPGVRVCVGNTGRHIDKKDIPHLFSPYFSKGKPDGTGLGLTISKKFVELHGGDIWCESSQDEGTKFTFVLPKGKVSIAEAKALPQANPGLENATFRPSLTVVLVEDSQAYRSALTQLIEGIADGFSFCSVSIIPAKSVPEALKICSSQQVDLAIVDDDLGVGSPRGASIIKNLTNEFGVPVVCLHSSGEVDESDNVGYDLVIPKPMDVEKGRRLLGAVWTKKSR